MGFFAEWGRKGIFQDPPWLEHHGPRMDLVDSGKQTLEERQLLAAH